MLQVLLYCHNPLIFVVYIWVTYTYFFGSRPKDIKTLKDIAKEQDREKRRADVAQRNEDRRKRREERTKQLEAKTKGGGFQIL